METKIATSVNQSKKLIELGINRDTADMHYSKWDNDENEEYHLKCGGLPKLEFKYATNIPAWSLSALIELMPASIIYGYSEDDLYLLNIHKDDYRYFVEYRKEIKSKISNCYKTKFEESFENLIDALFNVTCHLLENKLI